MNGRAMACRLLALGVLLATAPASAQVRVVSPANKHNLSTTGPGPVKSTTLTEICVFCHTPHNSNPAVPLWNQTVSGATYQPYTSTTMTATPGLPTGSSKLCLSCHDGTVAIGNTVNNGQIPMQGVTAQGRLSGPSVLGSGLGDDHPIAFVPVTGSQIVNPPGGSPVKLDGSGQVQCATCHDPHQMDVDPTTKKFLVMNNAASGLCVVCHNKEYWATNPSTHKSSTKSFTAAQGAHTGYTTVATNGCESCHKPHTATVPQRGLKAQEEATCGSCHGSTAIGRNIEAEFVKTYRHPTYSTTPSVHDASESPTSTSYPLPERSSAASRHAECPDCHNAHASYDAATTAPKGSGKLAGVWGVDTNNLYRAPSGSPPSVSEFEICYKCHGDSANIPQAGGSPAPPYPTRVVPQFNMRLMFDPANPSFHPIEAASTAVPISLKPGIGPIIYCTDCHDNDQGPKAPTPGTGPLGPHGSSYKHLLAGQYLMDNASYTNDATSYALCYKCHDRTKVLTNLSWPRHNQHIIDLQGPCSLCHDPHGVAGGASGGTVARNDHLINFDRRFVTPCTGTGCGTVPYWQQTTAGTATTAPTGLCYLTCHAKNHPGCTYNGCP